MANAKDVILAGIDMPLPVRLSSIIFMPFRSMISPRLRVITPITGVSLTKQSFKDECDINNILKSYAKTGLLTHLNPNPGSYMDLTNIDPDYLQTLNTINEASDTFSLLPSQIRKKFDNDPLTFLTFVSNPANANELVSLGLANPPAPAAAPPAASGDGGPAGGGLTTPA